MKQSVILTDVDGVLLNYEYAFDIWVAQHGLSKQPCLRARYSFADQYNISEDKAMEYVLRFNESAAIGYLPPLRDAMHYVRKLHEKHGYVFRAITSLGTDAYAGKLRRMNLEKLFGPTTFESIVCLETCAPKRAALEQYRDSECYWIEDNVANAVAGAELGLNSLLVEHGHNMDHVGPGVRLVKDWKDVYDIVTGR